MPETPEWREIGRHRYHHLGDSLHVAWHGDVSTDEIRHLLDIESRIQAQYGYVLNLNLICSDLRIDAAARRVIAHGFRVHGIRLYAAVVGATLMVRTLAMMVIRSASVVYKQTPEVSFCATEEKAQEWLAARRLTLP